MVGHRLSRGPGTPDFVRVVRSFAGDIEPDRPSLGVGRKDEPAAVDVHKHPFESFPFPSGPGRIQRHGDGLLRNAQAYLLARPYLVPVDGVSAFT